MANMFEIRLTLEVNNKQIELEAEFEDGALLFARLTDEAKEFLRNQRLGSLESAVKDTLHALGLEGEVTRTIDDIKAQIAEIPGVGEITRLLDADVHLTDLDFRPGHELVIGVLIDYSLTVTILTVSRLGVKATIDLSEAEPASE